METARQFINRKNEKFSAERNKLIKMKDIGRKGAIYFIREDWEFLPQSDLKEKVFILEKLRLVKTEGKITHTKAKQAGKVAYRIGYFIIGKIGKRKGKWIWGQFCPMIPSEDFNELLSQAKKMHK